jgi:hypothetical protein
MLAMAEPKSSDLTREKTLLALWRTSFKFPKRRFNFVVTALVAITLARYCQLDWDQPQKLMAAFRKIEGTGFSFATSILGFLVAGFTVFVTVIRIDMFLTMARTEKANTGESVLKYNLSAFIVTFVHYTSYIFVCLMSELFLQPGGLASVAFANANTYPHLAPWTPLAHRFCAAVLLVTFGAWTAYMVLLLKSFIYNVYQVTTVSVAYAWQEADKKNPSTGRVAQAWHPLRSANRYGNRGTRRRHL